MSGLTGNQRAHWAQAKAIGSGVDIELRRACRLPVRRGRKDAEDAALAIAAA
jgi:hypothetical protein